MILGLSDNARQFEQYYTDSELWPLENHKFHKDTFVNTPNLVISGGGGGGWFHFLRYGNLTWFTLSMILGLSENALREHFPRCTHPPASPQLFSLHINLFFNVYGVGMFVCLHVYV